MMDISSDKLEKTNDPGGNNQTPTSTKSESKIVNESNDKHQRLTPDTGNGGSESHQEGNNAPAILPKKVPNTSPDQDDYIVALRPEKGLDKLPLRRNTENVAKSTHSDQGVIFSKVPEKPTGDGYNWRKYGQKLVKGNTFVRSYYKCTYANCPARKQVERSHDGHITEINYLWKHEHPKPPHTPVKGSALGLPVQSRGSDEPSLTTNEDPSFHDPEASETETHHLSVVPLSENSAEAAASQSNEMQSEVHNDISSDSKRQKRENSSIINEGISTKTNCEPRIVVQTTSPVDIVNDGYRWRKYGQKLVKGNPNPRSYYRCSNAGCLAKKHVERASHDEKVVITTYEGRHDHDMPSGGRTVTQNTSGTASGTTSLDNNGSMPQPEARESSGMDIVLHVSAT